MDGFDMPMNDYNAIKREIESLKKDKLERHDPEWNNAIAMAITVVSSMSGKGLLPSEHALNVVVALSGLKR